MASVETLNRVIGERAQSLFGSTSEEVQREIGRLGVNRQFSIFSRQFFLRLTERWPDYFAIGAFAHHVGEGKRFTTLAQQAEFSDGLGLHCEEACKIVEEFSGGWFAKTTGRRDALAGREQRDSPMLR